MVRTWCLNFWMYKNLSERKDLPRQIFLLLLKNEFSVSGAKSQNTEFDKDLYHTVSMGNYIILGIDYIIVSISLRL